MIFNLSPLGFISIIATIKLCIYSFDQLIKYSNYLLSCNQVTHHVDIQLDNQNYVHVSLLFLSIINKLFKCELEDIFQQWLARVGAKYEMRRNKKSEFEICANKGKEKESLKME